MENIKNKERLVDEKIEEYLKVFGAVVIEEPKYSGKTWAGRYHAKSETLLYNRLVRKPLGVGASFLPPFLCSSSYELFTIFP